MAETTITFANHASVILDGQGVKLLTDPWYVGAAFHNGWELHSPTGITPDDLNDVQYVWISHEHPDHFSIETINEWLVPHKDHLTLLFKTTTDQRVPNFLRSRGFTLRELPDGEVVNLAPKVDVLCKRIGLEDSMLLTRMGDTVILNSNDAIVLAKDIELLKQYGLKFGRPDVLLSQFSYAGKVGNRDEPGSSSQKTLREQDAASVRQLVVKQAEEIRPRALIPFASYKFFSHAENFYMSDAMGTPDQVERDLASVDSVRTVILYPGDRWAIGEPNDNAAAVAKFASDLEAIKPVEYDEERSNLEQLMRLAAGWVRRTKVHSSAVISLMRQSPLGFSLRSVPIRLTDLDETVLLDVRHGLILDTDEQRDDVVEMSSPNLAFMLTNDFGGMTLMINARYQASPRMQQRLRTFSQLGVARASGQPLTVVGLAKDSVRIAAFLFSGRNS